ncbi:unnamed protein product [Heligmosomoides polygyrus]|uniref:IF rod domain-containing protein n=1 Tax=Heligmosomoides polygyrus TaxID=6339 RepID=A0A183GNW2_HELPZ|nr:unnamed protein product [Heligmosomoides polygyrus]
MDKRLEEERRKKEAEIASLMDLHSRNMGEMRDMYEERIAALEVGFAAILRIQHEELAQAYNDLNEEFEKYKEATAVTAQDNNNQDLTRRIDLLKANLIEYEERYEMCKRENMETVAQLERLSGEFERLKTGFADVEVDRLRTALEHAKQDRDRLRADVDRFRSTIEGIDAELDNLRTSNRNLCQENEKMAAVIDR